MLEMLSRDCSFIAWIFTASNFYFMVNNVLLKSLHHILERFTKIAAISLLDIYSNNGYFTINNFAITCLYMYLQCDYMLW